MTLVAISGAGGFVGQSVCAALRAQGIALRTLSRRAELRLFEITDNRIVGDLTKKPDLTAALTGVDTVIHLAARVHVMRETAADPLTEFRLSNVMATEHLAQSAAAAGVRRLVFVSTAKVNGEATYDAPFRESDPPTPQDPYAISKWEAEQALWRIAADVKTGLEVVVVRPPLVYGPNVGGNFVRLLRWIKRGVPLPFASVRNRRSLIYVGNLADALVTCTNKPEAAGKTYLISDDQAHSTPELIRHLAQAMGQSPHLWPCPPALLMSGGRMLGKQAEIERLIGSLELDSEAIRRELRWTPPFTSRQGLEITANWYKGEQ